MPAVLAAAGTSSLITLAVIAVRAMLLAALFGQLTRRVPNSDGGFQNLTVPLKFLPLLFVGVVGWFFVSSGNFGAFNASGGSLYRARRERWGSVCDQRRGGSARPSSTVLAWNCPGTPREASVSCSSTT